MSTKKELLFYAKCEVSGVNDNDSSFEVRFRQPWPWLEVMPLDDAPWVTVGQKIVIEVAYHTSPGGTKTRVTTITPIEEESTMSDDFFKVECPVCKTSRHVVVADDYHTYDMWVWFVKCYKCFRMSFHDDLETVIEDFKKLREEPNHE